MLPLNILKETKHKNRRPSTHETIRWHTSRCIYKNFCSHKGPSTQDKYEVPGRLLNVINAGKI
jgi:hypothetical protein